MVEKPKKKTQTSVQARSGHKSTPRAKKSPNGVGESGHKEMEMKSCAR